MIEGIVNWLMAWCERRGRVLKITGTAGPDDVYLIRYYLLRSRFANVFIHQFLRSDRDDLHDHPWDFATYLVRGSYTEFKWNEETGREERTRRANYPCALPECNGGCGRASRFNSLVFRRATDQHQVVVDRDLKEADKASAPLTVCVTGPTRREWGFVRNVTVQPRFLPIRQWVPWREYLGLPPGTPGRG